MRGSRRSEEQIIGILKQREKGMATAELCRQEGISEQTVYRWKAKYGGLDNGDAKKLKQLDEENRKLKHVVAELTLDTQNLGVQVSILHLSIIPNPLKCRMSQIMERTHEEATAELLPESASKTKPLSLWTIRLTDEVDHFRIAK